MLPVLAVAASAVAAAAPAVGGCPVFPADNPWNQDVSTLPVAARSAQYVRSIGLGEHLHADVASTKYGIPFRVVPATQKQVPIHFTAYGEDSDPGPYPIPRNAPVETGTDRHVVVVQKSSCRLYELFNAHRRGKGWDADSGAVFDLRSDAVRPIRWTSADAAGLPIFPGLIRADDVVRDRAITHALRVTVPKTQKGFIFPARHQSSPNNGPNLPPMGLRLRLKAGFDLRPFKGQALVILTALKTYGMIVADNGAPWYITGAPDRRFNDRNLRTLGQVPGSAFEAVQTGDITK
jgi:hypothetical protein